MEKYAIDLTAYIQEITRYDNKLKLEEWYFKNKRPFSTNKQEMGIVSIKVAKLDAMKSTQHDVLASSVTDIIQILCDIYADANGQTHNAITNEHPYITIMGLYEVVENECYDVRLCYNGSNGFLRYILSVMDASIYSFEDVSNESTVPEKVKPIEDPNRKYLYQEFETVKDMAEFLNQHRVAMRDIVLASAVLDKPALIYYGKV